MRIHVATDHAGLEFAQTLITHLEEQGHEVTDHGPQTYEPLDDYPSFCIAAARAVVRDQTAGLESLGVVFGGSGNGEQIAANKVPGIRAALAWTANTAALARQHNDANVLSLGAREYSTEDAVALAKIFLETPFSGEIRHARRLAAIAAYEVTGELPPLPLS